LQLSADFVEEVGLKASVARDSIRWGQTKLFYEFCLEDRIPADHMLRKIDRFLDLAARLSGTASPAPTTTS
jgi:hypothetical protein